MVSPRRVKRMFTRVLHLPLQQQQPQLQQLPQLQLPVGGNTAVNIAAECRQYSEPGLQKPRDACIQTSREMPRVQTILIYLQTTLSYDQNYLKNCLRWNYIYQHFGVSAGLLRMTSRRIVRGIHALTADLCTGTTMTRILMMR